MDLYCCEQSAENETKAYYDPTLLQDRVLKNLLETEDRYVLPYPASLVVQDEITPGMRKIVAEWMMEVCDEQKCQEEVFSLAMNYMDRFLMCCKINKNQLQLLGTACMLLASKLRESRPLAGETLVYYTDNSVTKQQLWNFELLVLNKLKWDVAAVTPQDFLKHLLNRLPLEDKWNINYDMVLNHAKTLITLCAREFVFSTYHPSIIACASIASALCGVGWVCKSGRSPEDLLQKLTEITRIEKEFLEECLFNIENMIRESRVQKVEYELRSSKTTLIEELRPGEFTPPPIKNKDHDTALTPTDLHNVHF